MLQIYKLYFNLDTSLLNFLRILTPDISHKPNKQQKADAFTPALPHSVIPWIHISVFSTKLLSPFPSLFKPHKKKKQLNNREIRGNLWKISSISKIICIFAALKHI